MFAGNRPVDPEVSLAALRCRIALQEPVYVFSEQAHELAARFTRAQSSVGDTALDKACGTAQELRRLGLR